MDAKYFEEIKAREQAATPGVWMTIKSASRECYHLVATDEVTIKLGEIYPNPDADFIAHARTDIPELISALREAQDENTKLISEVQNSHNEIATLKKALEMACKRNAEYAFCGGTEAMKEKHAEKNFQYFIQQAQEQEGEK